MHQARQPLPRYADLPSAADGRHRHAWKLWGLDDELGRVNLVTEATIRAAASEIRRGALFNLCLPLDQPGSTWVAGRKPFRHHIAMTSRNAQDDYLDGFYLQGSTQWDGLRHIRAGAAGFYGGVTDHRATVGGHLGISHWAEHGLVGRGVVVDVEGHLRATRTRYDPLDAFAISPSLLSEMLQRQDVVLTEGDFLLLRTGYLLRNPSGAGPRTCAGLAGSEEMAAFLWDSGVVGVAADNPVVEVSPGNGEDGSLHRRLIPYLGFALGEYFFLENLVADCRDDGRWTCFFNGTPLNLPGGAGSPANAVALK